jgi:hypothetical protein
MHDHPDDVEFSDFTFGRFATFAYYSCFRPIPGSPCGIPMSLILQTYLQIVIATPKNDFFVLA